MMNYSIGMNLERLVKLAKKGYPPAQLLLAATDLTRSFGMCNPENADELMKHETRNTFTNAAGGDATIAKLKLRSVIDKLTIVEGWLDVKNESKLDGLKAIAESDNAEIATFVDRVASMVINGVTAKLNEEGTAQL